MTAASTGLSENSLRHSGITYEKVYIHPSGHAEHYGDYLSDGCILDVRSQKEHGYWSIPNSINIPLNELREKLHTLDKKNRLWCIAAQVCAVIWPFEYLNNMVLIKQKLCLEVL